MSESWGGARQVLDQLREGVQVIDPQWRYVYVNPAAAAHGRTTPEALVGRTMQACYPGIDQTPMFERLARCMQTGQPDNLSNEFAYPDGSKGWFDLRIQAVPEGLVVLSIDVTEQRLQEERQQHAARLEALGRLAGGVAHDFNNLLTAILAHADFLGMDYAEPNHDVAAIQAAAIRATTLTQQLMTFARRRVPSVDRVDLQDAAVEVLTILGGTLGRGFEVVKRLGAARTRLASGCAEQLVMNLVLNARDALDTGGRIVVETREISVSADALAPIGAGLPSGRYALLAVSDEGPGIPDEVLQHLFEPFFSSKIGGTGLGLATCWGIAQQAGGHIRVYSEPGRGATFRVYLPIDGSGGIVSLPPASGDLRGTESVLVVDDDPYVAEIATRTLAESGYQADGVNTPEAFRARLAEGVRPSLLVMDMCLTGENGTDLVRHAQKLLPDIRVLYMSGYTELALHTRGMVVDVIEKPFNPAELRERVRAILDYQRP